MLFGSVLWVSATEIRFRSRVWPLSVYRFMADPGLRGPVIAALPAKVTLWFSKELASDAYPLKLWGWTHRIPTIPHSTASQWISVLEEVQVTVTAIYVGKRPFPICMFRRSLSVAIPIVWATVLASVLVTQWGAGVERSRLSEVLQWMQRQETVALRPKESAAAPAESAGLGPWMSGLPETVTTIEMTAAETVIQGLIPIDVRDAMEAKLHQLPKGTTVTQVTTSPRGESQLDYAIVLHTSD